MLSSICVILITTKHHLKQKSHVSGALWSWYLSWLLYSHDNFFFL